MPPDLTPGATAPTVDDLATPEAKAVMNAASRNKLSNSDFAYVDAQGGRHLPVNDAAHARAALSRFSETQFESPAAKAKARAAILAACKKFGIDVSADAMKSLPLDEDDLEFKADDLPETVEYKTLAFSMDPGDDLQPNEFKGYVAITGNVDATGDIIPAGAFKDVIPDFKQNGCIYWQHQLDEPIGKPLEVHEDAKGLFIHAKISDTPRGRKALTLMRDGVVDKLSIGYVPKSPRYLSHTEGKQLLGEAAYKDALDNLPPDRVRIRVLGAFRKLFDGSLVTLPANERTKVLGVKGGLPDGLTYADHCSAVLATNEEFLERTRAIAEMRFKSGRTHSATTVAEFVTLRDCLASHVSMLDGMIEAHAPKSAPRDEEAETKAEERAAAIRHELALYLETEARLSGALST